MEGLQTIWFWQPALYLFLGGMGAGAFVMAAILHFLDREGSRRVVCASSWAAAACMVVGLLLLVSELTNPLRGMMLWQSFSSTSSWMTFGAWIVFAAVVVSGCMALITTAPVAEFLAKRWKAFPRIAGKLADALAVIGALLGVCVAAYTGILLMSAPGVPLWNTLLLPCLFTVSALDTGVALVELVERGVERKAVSPRLSGKAHKLQSRVVCVLVVAELLVLAAFLSGALSGSAGDTLAQVAAASAALLASGQLAVLFWVLVVAAGLALPLVMAVASLAAKNKRAESYVTAGAVGALVGGCALRFLVLAAGLHADLIASTVLHSL